MSIFGQDNRFAQVTKSLGTRPGLQAMFPVKQTIEKDSFDLILGQAVAVTNQMLLDSGYSILPLTARAHMILRDAIRNGWELVSKYTGCLEVAKDFVGEASASSSVDLTEKGVSILPLQLVTLRGLRVYDIPIVPQPERVSKVVLGEVSITEKSFPWGDPPARQLGDLRQEQRVLEIEFERTDKQLQDSGACSIYPVETTMLLIHRDMGRREKPLLDPSGESQSSSAQSADYSRLDEEEEEVA